jgi:hypothetical protein
MSVGATGCGVVDVAAGFAPLQLVNSAAVIPATAVIPSEARDLLFFMPAFARGSGR